MQRIVMLILVISTSAGADVFVLKSGGKVRGESIEKTATHVTVKTKTGKVKLALSQIQQIISEPSAEEQYAVIKEQYRDKADDQYRLAMWCGRNGLKQLKQQHLQRALELDADHSAARAGMGYRKLNGKWVTETEWYHSRGMVKVGNRWVKAQTRPAGEVVLSSREALAKWGRYVRTIRSRYLSSKAPQKRAQGVALLLKIRDPHAVPIIIDNLKDGPDADKIVLCQVLEQFTTPAALKQLLWLAVVDDSIEMRERAIDALVKVHHPGVTQALIRGLDPNYPVVLERCAFALGQLDDAAAIVPLIDVLQTTRTEVRQIAQAGGGSGTRRAVVRDFKPVVAPGTVAFDPIVSYEQSMTMFGPGPTKTEIIDIETDNREVLEALRTLTGQNFGFQQQAWLTWYQSAKVQAELRAKGK